MLLSVLLQNQSSWLGNMACCLVVAVAADKQMITHCDQCVFWDSSVSWHI